jgi:Cu-Zn family superoxide dismutase
MGSVPIVAAEGQVARAVAVLSPTEGNAAAGTVVFTKSNGGLRVSVSLTGLMPGPHGFHIHEFGDCPARDGSSAGGHFNPAEQKQAGRQEAERHAGDLGNVEAGPDGKVAHEFLDALLRLEERTGIAGRSVIVHAQADDLQTQPAGNAGGRMACGVVGIA